MNGFWISAHASYRYDSIKRDIVAAYHEAVHEISARAKKTVKHAKAIIQNVINASSDVLTAVKQATEGDAPLRRLMVKIGLADPA